MKALEDDDDTNAKSLIKTQKKLEDEYFYFKINITSSI